MAGGHRRTHPQDQLLSLGSRSFRILSPHRAANGGATAAFVPQVTKSWSSRDLSGISLRMDGLFTTGVALWLIYGIALRSWPIIVRNLITLMLAGGVLLLKPAHR